MCLAVDLAMYEGYMAQYLIEWEHLSSTTMWYIWKAHCTYYFKDIVVSLAETIGAIWKDLIMTLSGQYDFLQGSSNAMMKQRVEFYGI